MQWSGSSLYAEWLSRQMRDTNCLMDPHSRCLRLQPGVNGSFKLRCHASPRALTFELPDREAHGHPFQSSPMGTPVEPGCGTVPTIFLVAWLSIFGCEGCGESLHEQLSSLMTTNFLPLTLHVLLEERHHLGLEESLWSEKIMMPRIGARSPSLSSSGRPLCNSIRFGMAWSSARASSNPADGMQAQQDGDDSSNF
eukprot:s1098_g5.t1